MLLGDTLIDKPVVRRYSTRIPFSLVRTSLFQKEIKSNNNNKISLDVSIESDGKRVLETKERNCWEARKTVYERACETFRRNSPWKGKQIYYYQVVELTIQSMLEMRFLSVHVQKQPRFII